MSSLSLFQSIFIYGDSLLYIIEIYMWINLTKASAFKMDELTLKDIVLTL